MLYNLYNTNFCENPEKRSFLGQRTKVLRDLIKSAGSTSLKPTFRGVMMERKLVRQGRDALTVTLPAKWIKQRALKMGDNVYLEYEGKNVLIKAKETSVSTEIIVDLTGEDRPMMWHTIIGKYISGYDRIVILHSNPSQTQYFTQYLLGMIIEEHTTKKTVLKTIVSTPENDIDMIIRRVVHMFLRASEIFEEFSVGKATFEDIRAQERLIDTNIYYCMRFINKYHLQQDSYQHFLLCSTIEEATDIITLMSQNGKNPRMAKGLKNTVEIFNKHFFTGNLKKVYTELRSFRDSLGKKTFLDGLAFQFAEVLYNNIGYLMENKKDK